LLKLFLIGSPFFILKLIFIFEKAREEMKDNGMMKKIKPAFHSNHIMHPLTLVLSPKGRRKF